MKQFTNILKFYATNPSTGISWVPADNYKIHFLMEYLHQEQEKCSDDFNKYTTYRIRYYKNGRIELITEFFSCSEEEATAAHKKMWGKTY